MGCMISVTPDVAHVVAQFLFILCNRNREKIASAENRDHKSMRKMIVRVEPHRHLLFFTLYYSFDRPAARLVRHTGFGNAAGLLFSLGIKAPPPATDDSDTDRCV